MLYVWQYICHEENLLGEIYLSSQNYTSIKKKIPEIMEGINLVSVLSAKSLRVAILKARLYISCVKKGD